MSVTRILASNGIAVDQLFAEFEEGETCKVFQMDLKIPGHGDRKWPTKFKAERIEECGMPFTKVSDFQLDLTPELEKELEAVLEAEARKEVPETPENNGEDSSPSESET